MRWQRFWLIGMLIVLILSVTVAMGDSQAAGGDNTMWLDPAWGGAGIAEPRLPIHEGVKDLVLLDDGSLVGIGTASVYPDYPNNTDFGIVKLRPDGTLDPTFGNNGVIITDVGPWTPDEIAGVAAYPHGDILTIGCQSKRVALVRYEANGELDTTFGDNGKVVLPAVIRPYYGCNGGIALQSDGRIVGIIGSSGTYVFRLLSDGQLDESLASQGYFNDSAPFIRVFSGEDGKILTVGSEDLGLVAAQFNSDGTADVSYGDAGRIHILRPILPYPPYPKTIATAYDAALTSDGRLMIVGMFVSQTCALDCILMVRATAGGHLDTSFSEDGIYIDDILTDTHERAVSVAVREDNSATIGVHSDEYFSVERPYTLRLQADGTRDPTFGDAGVVRFAFDKFQPSRGSAVGPDGKIYLGGVFNEWAVRRLNGNGSFDRTYGMVGTVVLGAARPSSGGYLDRLSDGRWVTASGGVMARFLPDGQPDLSLRGQGYAPFDFDPRTIVVDSQDRIVAVGGNESFGMVWRTTLDAMLDPTFDGDGVVIDTLEDFSPPQLVLEQSDQKLLVFSTGSISNQSPGVAIVRYSVDGARDHTYGHNGQITLECNASNALTSVKAIVQPSDALIVAHQCGESLRLYRLTVDGAPDMTFGNNGIMDITTPQFGALFLAQDVGGRIVVGGAYLDMSDGGQYGTLIRATPQGILDTTFGQEGITTFLALDEFRTLDLWHLLQDEAQRWYLVASTDEADNVIQAAFAFRFSADGEMDTDFGTNGRHPLTISDHDVITDALWDNGGMVLTGGYHFTEDARTSPVKTWARFTLGAVPASPTPTSTPEPTTIPPAPTSTPTPEPTTIPPAPTSTPPATPSSLNLILYLPIVRH